MIGLYKLIYNMVEKLLESNMKKDLKVQAGGRTEVISPASRSLNARLLLEIRVSLFIFYC